MRTVVGYGIAFGFIGLCVAIIIGALFVRWLAKTFMVQAECT